MHSAESFDGRLLEEAVEKPHWALRALTWTVATLRPESGWLVLFVCMGLAALPTMALGENRLAELRRIQVGLDLVGPLAVAATWLWLGWQRPFHAPAKRSVGNWLRNGAVALAILLTGLLVLSQVLVNWLPNFGELWQALLTNGWLAIGQQMFDGWVVMATRFALWWQGVQAGGAAQDNLIFAAIAGAVFWLMGALVAWLVRRYHQGLLAAAPVLWLLGTLLLYSPSGRGLMIGGMLLALALHLLLDQQALMRRWQVLQLDFSPGLLFDRLVAVSGVAVIAILLAVFLPNWYIGPVVRGYYELIEPLEQGLEDFRDRLFPDLRGASRLHGSGLLDGLPNDFLLSGGVGLGESVVMYVRTNDSAGYSDYMGGPPGDIPPPPGHYMRGVTLTQYDGHGWSNPAQTMRTDHIANERWREADATGRKALVQSVTLQFNTSILYGAPEMIEPGVDYSTELRAGGDLVALWSRARNYTIVSSIPAVSSDELAATPSWGTDQPLPAGYEVHLALPDTITDRTRALAAEVTAGQSTIFGKAQAIEQYLRQYEYDLTISDPPADVQDVADYFLFDLRRGYCDYYSTAFIVMARLVGLPTRFATGYAVGAWDPVEAVWIVTEAEAHSWPEVYFPEYGWIPFEPTAGRAELARIGLPPVSTGPVVPVAPAPEMEAPAQNQWNWQMLFWLLPLGLALWGGWTLLQRWRNEREDPWTGLLRWGQQAGRPLDRGETVLEYGDGLATFIVAHQRSEQDSGRVAAREVNALTAAVNLLHYAPSPERAAATALAMQHWSRLRGYLSRLRLR